MEKQSDLLFFRLDLSVEQGGTFKLFYGTGDGFSESHTVTQQVPGGKATTNVVVPLPRQPVERLRLDPTDNGSRYHFAHLEITNGFGKALRAYSVEQLRPWDPKMEYRVEDGFLYAPGDQTNGDPAYVLEIDDYPSAIDRSFKATLARFISDYWFPVCVLLILLGFGVRFWIYGLTAFCFWVVFDPGFYSPDSIDQIIQATRGSYWNQHPPVMSWLMRFWLLAGLSVRDLIFAQGLLGIFGLRLLILNVFTAWESSGSGRIRVREIVALILVLGFVSFLTPLVYYWNTLWKDSWAIIQFTWLMAWLVGSWNQLRSNRKIPIWQIAGLGLWMVLIVLTRYNAIVITPVFAGILTLLLWRRNKTAALAVGVMIFVACFAAKPLLHRVLDVWEAPIENQMITLDLVGFYKLYPELRHEVPYTADNLQPDWEERFEWANVYPISFTRPLIVTEEYGSYTRENPELKQEFFHVFRHFPLQLLHVKWTHFVHLFGGSYTHFWFANDIFPNEVGIEEKPHFKDLREKMVRRSLSISQSPWRWLSGVHLVWILANLLLILLSTTWAVRKFNIPQLLLVLITLFPMAYYCSYLISAPARDFRYMYPSTLIIQAIAAATIAFLLVNGIQKLTTVHKN